MCVKLNSNDYRKEVEIVDFFGFYAESLAKKGRRLIMCSLNLNSPQGFSYNQLFWVVQNHWAGYVSLLHVQHQQVF